MELKKPNSQKQPRKIKNMEINTHNADILLIRVIILKDKIPEITCRSINVGKSSFIILS